MHKTKKIIGSLVFCLTVLPAGSFAQEIPSDCIAQSDVSQTKPATVDFAKVLEDIKNLKDLKGRSIMTTPSPEFQKDLKNLFEVDPKTISKLEQFYGLLFLLGKYKTYSERYVQFDTVTVKNLLISTRVFSTPDIPNFLAEVSLNWSSHFEQANYEVKFTKSEFQLPLNKGKGFATYREGLCQVAKALVFYGGFHFRVQLTSGGNFYVDEFKNVDLFGIFGSRGTVDVDIQYVSVKSVEFLKGSPFGTVRAKVSRREFEKNEHSWLLRLVTQFVTDKSTQPIDW